MTSAGDELSGLYQICDRFSRLYPEGDAPFAIVTRLAEEVGELATEVQRLEGAGVKVQKHGPGQVADLASEVEDVLHTALSLIRYYGAESALQDVLDREIAKADRDLS